MRRQTLLLIVAIVSVLVAASNGTASAEEARLDQEWATHDSRYAIDGGWTWASQASRAGTTGTLQKVSVLVGCCAGTAEPTSGLRVTVSAHGVSTTETVSKETFRNDDALHWVDVPLSSPLPVQAGSYPSGVSIQLAGPRDARSPYEWAIDTRSLNGTQGGYAGGSLTTCLMEVPRSGMYDCNSSKADAAFRTYVVPGPDVIPPQTDLPTAVSNVSNGPQEGVISRADDVTFKFYALENGQNVSGYAFQCRLDGGGWEACTSPREYTGLADGAHTFEVRALDPAGNPDLSPESRRWTVDTTRPTITGVSPADGARDVPLGSDVEVTFSEAMSQSPKDFELKAQGSSTAVGATVGYDSATHKATLDPWSDLAPNTTYTATVRGGGWVDGSWKSGWIDYAGNGLEDYSWTFTTASAAQTTITSGPSGTVKDASASFTFTSSVSDATYRCRVSGGTFAGGTWNTCQSPWDVGSLPDATYTAEVHAIDGAGNAGPISSRTWTVDTTAPGIPVIASPANDSSHSDGDLTISGNAETGVTVELREGPTLVGAATADGAGNWTVVLEDAGEGEHTYTARATDAVGNVSEDSEPIRVAVDTTAPVVTQTTPQNTGVDRSVLPAATFSDEMNAASLDGSTKLYAWNSRKKAWKPVPVAVSVVGKTVTLDPHPDDPRMMLAAGTKHKVTVTTGAENLAGIQMERTKNWTFTTRR